MKDTIIIIRRFAWQYKGKLALNFMFNVLSAFFAVFSMAMMIPILEILFNLQEDVNQMVPWAMNLTAVKHNVYYYITQIKIDLGVGWALLYVGVFIIVGTALKTGCAYGASYVLVGVRNRVVRDIRQKLYAKIIRLPLGFYSDERKGDIMSRVMNDVQEVENSVMSSLAMLLKNPVLILVFLGTLMVMSFQLTLFILVMLPIAGLVIGQVGKNLKRTSREGQDKLGDIVNILEETLSGLRIIKAFNAEKKMDDRFDGHLNHYRRISNRLARRRDLAHPMSELLGTIVIVMVVWFGGTLILNQEAGLSGAVFLSFIGIFYQIINPAKEFSSAFYAVQRGIAAMDRIDWVMMAQNNIQDSENAKTVEAFHHAIEYRNVTFAYSDRTVLKNVSLSIPKGQTIALVGQSGSGKTTFVDLLPRFYDVADGAIFIDGVNIKEMHVHDLRGLMGNVNQEAILFNDTIFNNIAFGVEDATLEQVMEAARVANAHDFIMATDKGYDSVIGDRGSKLSGGQRQRLSIARAILKNPAILILDEATSALDTESERLVQEALEKLMANRTSIVIAHRLSTVRNANLICVFQEGEIVERGTHDQLMAHDGVYKKLQSLQMR
jgi:subfamily B ATP-binding cassette protein MsbA